MPTLSMRIIHRAGQKSRILKSTGPASPPNGAFGGKHAAFARSLRVQKGAIARFARVDSLYFSRFFPL